MCVRGVGGDVCEACPLYAVTASAVALAGAVVSDDPRQVVIESVAILVDGRPDLVFPLDTPEAVAALSTRVLVFKEGTSSLPLHVTGTSSVGHVSEHLGSGIGGIVVSIISVVCELE